MNKKTWYALFITSCFMANAWADSCPSARDFELKMSWWDKSWALKEDGVWKNYSNHTAVWHSSPTGTTLPGNTRLVVRSYNNAISCEYFLDAGYMNYRAYFPGDASLRGDQWKMFDDEGWCTTPQAEGMTDADRACPISKEFSCATTADNPARCSFE